MIRAINVCAKDYFRLPTNALRIAFCWVTTRLQHHSFAKLLEIFSRFSIRSYSGLQTTETAHHTLYAIAAALSTALAPISLMPSRKIPPPIA